MQHKFCFNMRTQHLGDVVMALPSIISCLDAGHEVGIYIAKQYTRLFMQWNIDWLNRWLPTEYEVRRIKHTGHRADMWANQIRQYGIDVSMERPVLQHDTYDGFLPDKYVVLAPYCDEKKKQWDTDKFRELGRWLNGNGYNVVIIGPARATSMCEVIADDHALNLCGKDTVTNWPDILKRATTVICPDTGTAHVSSLVGTHPITLFGHTSALTYAPYWSKQYVICGSKTKDIPLDRVKQKVEILLNA